MDHVTLDPTNEANALRAFHDFYEKNSNPVALKRLRNIYARTNDRLMTTSAIAERDLNANLAPQEIIRLQELIMAFLQKSSFRRQPTLPNSEHIKLLKSQNDKCALCGCSVDLSSPVDHIVPFLYVGDELDNNYQVLCKSCNSKKKERLFYQINYLDGRIG